MLTERLIRLPTVLAMVGLGKATIYDMMKNNDFPKPRRVRNLSLWVESEVQNWIENIKKTHPSSAQPSIKLCQAHEIHAPSALIFQQTTNTSRKH
ncbi:helix-turn-helix transcriptional regulator [Burkholderia stabilis]|uniref:helix-turn-helix transcriptional regulator n=1 Tax=Burkholderia stabilis TaxID=95485 RepID=UPI0018D47AA6|nr:AlpA family phage regulatory protein [Burkholderia stabilis]HDR9522580.1 AlpA family phage regulatory protein [Burkholderia stabilis]HDR9533102.1 AlpA family phage regulatory protein [Burkholderia stabilis]HDR9537733.1 AlpA family phage regulatory protein [Burkholderia stabilis]HDR9544578.1 AlpA family phage regulatory protein [Burkholderia stabilis]